MSQIHQETLEPEHQKNAYICRCQASIHDQGKLVKASRSHPQDVPLIQVAASTSKQKDGENNANRLNVHGELSHAGRFLLISRFLKTTYPSVGWYSEFLAFYQEKGMHPADA